MWGLNGNEDDQAHVPKCAYQWGQTAPIPLPDFARLWAQLRQDPTPFMMLRALSN
jgi:hypothetical protein